MGPSWGRRLVGVEGLRGLAAVCVLIGHVGLHLGDGMDIPGMGHGLTLFFALSGFLLFRPYASALLTDRTLPSTKRFFINRALRIYPAYLVILIVVALCIGKAYTSGALPGGDVGESGDNVGFLTNPGLLAVNALMIHTLFPFSIKTGIGPSWSLTVELVFYVILPALALISYKVSTRFRAHPLFTALGPVFVVFIVGIIGKVILHNITAVSTPEESFYLNWGSNWTAVFARSFLTQSDLFAFGMLAAVAYTLFEIGSVSSRRLAIARWGLLILTAVIAAAARNSIFSTTGFALLSASLILFVTLPAQADRHGLLSRFLELRPIAYVGAVSYSMYLWHGPVIWLLRDTGLVFPPTLPGLAGNILLVFSASMILSVITYELVEKQALRLKTKFNTSSHAVTSSTRA